MKMIKRTCKGHGLYAGNQYLFVVINIYWFCYQSFREWGINIGVVDKILLNFQRTAGLFSNILYTKSFLQWYSCAFLFGNKGSERGKNSHGTGFMYS